VIAHVDDDELPNSGPIRLKARDRPPTRKPKLKEVGKRDDSKLGEVRGDKQKGKEKNAELLRSIQLIFSKNSFYTRLNSSVGKVILRQTGPVGIDKTWL
jgi:hypothetical protein